MLIMEHQDLRCCARINTLCCRNVSQCITSIMEEWRKHPNAVRGKHTGIRQTGSLALQQASAFLYIHPGADWPLGAPERFPVAWRLIWPACPFFLYIFFLLLFFLFFISFAFPMCQSDHFRLWHSLINHNRLVLTGSAARHVCSLPPSNQRYLTAIRTYFTRWLIRTNSYDLTRTI